MGELIDYREFTKEERFGSITRLELRPFSWYFPEEIKTEGTSSSSIDWHQTISRAYPEHTAIHWDVFESKPEIKPTIRRFVRDHCAGDVIHMSQDKSYKYLHRYRQLKKDKHGKQIEVNRAYRSNVEHGYNVFYFETSVDAVAFGLAFMAICGPIEERHPEYVEVTEEEIADAAQNPYGIYEEW